MKYKSTILLVILALLAAIATGCESDEFADAPTATAPERDQAASAPQAEPAAPAPRIGQGEQIPADHPPIQGSQARQDSPGSVAPARGGASPQQYGKTGPLRWEAPESWKAVKPASNMRIAEYHMSGPDGGEPAVMAISYFGPTQGGPIEANISRWINQFKGVSEGAAKQQTRQVNGVTVHTVDVSGAYAGMGGGPGEPNRRLLGAIAEAPAGKFFFKLVGPKPVVDAHADEFDSFISSLQPANAGK